MKQKENSIEPEIERFLSSKKEATLTDVVDFVDTLPPERRVGRERVRFVLNEFVRDNKAIKPSGVGGKYIWMGGNKIDFSNFQTRKGDIEYTEEQAKRIPQGIIYDDWNGMLDRMKSMYNLGVFTLLIGPKGTGKTEAVRKMAEDLGLPMYPVNLSLRAREHHLIGRLSLKNGSDSGKVTADYFKPGPVIQSMECGGILYLDELNAAEPDVLLRLDECLDDRREVNVEGSTYRANKGWWVVATINPLSHAGTKELPPQILSRFGARFKFPYPELKEEMRIVQMHVGRIPANMEYSVEMALKVISAFREEHVDLQYKPSIRESIATVKMILAGYSVQDALEIALINTYTQFDDIAEQDAKNLVKSLLKNSGNSSQSGQY